MWPPQISHRRECVHQGLADTGPGTSIVFSFWKTTLDLVGQLLAARGLGFYMIHGSLPLSERRRILDGFRSAGNAHILLMTLGTGAVG